jgi:hypothetical protein
VVLDAHRLHGREHHPSARPVVQVDVGHLDALGQAVCIHRIVVVLRNHTGIQKQESHAEVLPYRDFGLMVGVVTTSADVGASNAYTCGFAKQMSPL